MTGLHVVLPPDVSADVVEVLEKVLAEAQDGKLSSIAVAKVYRDGSTGWSWSIINSTGMLGGSIQRMLHRFNLLVDEL